MSARQFSKVSPAVWRSGRFLALADPRAQLLYLFYLSCHHQTSAGCFRLPDGYACSDLGWVLPEYVESRGCLVDADLLTFDAVTSEFFVNRWFQHCPPMNDNHAAGIRRVISELESDAVREKAEAEFEEADATRKVVPLHRQNTSPALMNSRILKGGKP